jgi:hypothetical protein
MLVTSALIAGGIGAVGKMVGRGMANAAMEKLIEQQPKYKANALARTLLNARMLGAAQAERNIQQAAATTMGRTAAAATSPLDVIQQSANVQAQQNQAYQGLQQQEAQDYARRYQDFMQEQKAQYADELRQFETKTQLQAAINANKQATMGDISNLGFQAANLAGMGAFGDKYMFGAYKNGGLNSFAGLGGLAGAAGNTSVPPTPPPGTITTNYASYAPGFYPNFNFGYVPRKQ